MITDMNFDTCDRSVHKGGVSDSLLPGVDNVYPFWLLRFHGSKTFLRRTAWGTCVYFTSHSLSRPRPCDNTVTNIFIREAHI